MHTVQTIAFEPQPQFLPLMTTSFPFAIIDANLFWCHRNDDMKDMSNQDFPRDTEAKKVVLLSFLVAVRAYICINTWLKSSFEIQSIYNCYFFHYLFADTTIRLSYNIEKRKIYFGVRYFETTTYICLFGKSSVCVIFLLNIFLTFIPSSYWKVM